MPRACAPRSHGPLELRQRDRHRAQRQCNACGRAVGRPQALASLEEEQRQDLPRWMPTKPKRPSQNSRARRYRAFLHSAEWKRTRLRVLDRAKWRCEGESCGESLRPPARATVHHLRYAADLRTVPDSDLRASCPRCNVHEREQRLGAPRGRA